MKGSSKIYKRNGISKNKGFIIWILLIIGFLWISTLSSPEITQSEAKKSSDNISTLKQQKSEARSLLAQINNEINVGNQLISKLATLSKPSKEDKNRQLALRGVAQELKLAAKDREIGAKEEKMKADIVDAEQTKSILYREINYLKKILDSTRRINSWLKKNDVSITQNTKNEAKKLLLSMKKAAEETNKKAQKKKSNP